MFVYILKCSNQKYYVGVTNNLERRLFEHHSGFNKKCYTYNKRPLELKFCDYCSNPLEAIAFEKKLKGWGRKKKEALFKKDWKLIMELAKNRDRVGHASTSSA